MKKYIKIGIKLFIMLFFLNSCESLSRVNRSEIKTGSTRVDLYGSYAKDSYPISKEISYLGLVNDLEKNRVPFRRYSENEFLRFYKELKIKGYGDNSPYWRWKVTYSKVKLKYLLENHLKSLSERRPNEVLTYQRGKWIKKPFSKSSFGELLDVRIVQRGKSGIAIKLLIKTSKESYLVVKEANIRYVLSASKNIGSDVKLYGVNSSSARYTKNPQMINPQLLPSAFIALEKSGGNYTIYGGGFGHGVGIPQWSVSDLTKNKNYSYARVIKRYYKNTDLKNLNRIKGINGKVRVGIMTDNFSRIEHKIIKMYSAKGFSIKTSVGKINLPPDSKIEFRVNNKQIEVICNGKSRVKTKQLVEIESKGMIGLTNIRRNIKKSKYPVYRGKFEVKLTKNSSNLVLINEVDIEDYLLQVVPSEMPVSFGLEALKVQAIAARTYAVKDILKNRYGYMGFHILDSAQSQVYNNLDENEVASKAVKATKSLIIVHKGEPIDAKYYSTSSGINSHAHNVW